MLPLQHIFQSGIRPGEAVSSVLERCCLRAVEFGVGRCGWRFFASFWSVPGARSVGGVIKFGEKPWGCPSRGANRVVWGGIVEDSGRLAASWRREVRVRDVGQGWSCGKGFHGLGEAWGFPWCNRVVRIVGGRFVGGGLVCDMFD